MKKSVYKVTSKVWLYPGMSGWHFLNIPEKESTKITKEFGAWKRGWGSLPVSVTLGKSIWATSIFPDKRSHCYLLPLKASVRKSEEIIANDTVLFSIQILA